MRLIWYRASFSLIALAACGGSERGEDSLVVERTTVGDTTTVRTVSGSAWGDTARLVEEVRIGALDGPEEVTFGSIAQVAVGDDGSMHVFDGQAVVIRKFDSAGKFVRTIGRRGQGPGELGMPLGAHFLSDGRLAVYDGRNSRITTYSPEGEPLETWPVQLNVRMMTGNAFAADSSDHLYVLTSRSSPGPDRQDRTVLLRIAPGGEVVDTLDVPRWPQNTASRSVCLAPRGQWTFHPSGGFVSGVSDAYSLDLRRQSGQVVRIQRVAQPVEFEPGERDELEKDIAESGPPIQSVSVMRGQDPVIVYGDRQTVPAAKPFFRRIMTGDDGRIWVQLHTRAMRLDSPADVGGAGSFGVSAPDRSPCNADRKGEPMRTTWGEPIVWDVFEADGSYLGPVAVPDRTTLRKMRGDRVWAVVRGESDEEYLMRFRLVPPEADSP